MPPSAAVTASEPFGRSNDLQLFFAQTITGNGIQPGGRNALTTEFLLGVQTSVMGLQHVKHPFDAFDPVSELAFAVAAAGKTGKTFKFVLEIFSILGIVYNCLNQSLITCYFVHK